MVQAVLLRYTDPETCGNTVSSLYGALSAGRRAKADGIKDPEAFKTSVIAGRLLEKYLSKLTGTAPSGLSYEEDAGGRPRLSNLPNTDFNISHTDGAVLAVFRSFSGPNDQAFPCVGCDIERVRSRFKKPYMPRSIIDRFFAEGEKELFEALLNGEERFGKAASSGKFAASGKSTEEELFFRFWTAKEAYGKMSGSGLSNILGSDVLVRNNGRIGYSDGTVLVSAHCGDLIMTFAIDRRLGNEPFVLTHDTVSGLTV